MITPVQFQHTITSSPPPPPTLSILHFKQYPPLIMSAPPPPPAGSGPQSLPPTPTLKCHGRLQRLQRPLFVYPKKKITAWKLMLTPPTPPTRPLIHPPLHLELRLRRNHHATTEQFWKCGARQANQHPRLLHCSAKREPGQRHRHQATMLVYFRILPTPMPTNPPLKHQLRISTQCKFV